MAHPTPPLLSPAGALAGHPAFRRDPTTEALGRAFASLAARELDVGDLAAAWELVRLAALEGPAALPAFWMAAALLELRRQGHTSLELPGEVPTLLGLGATEQAAWQAFVREGAPVASLVGEVDGRAPLVRLVDAAGTLAVALARDVAQERRLARFARRARGMRTFTPEAVRAALASPTRRLHAEQSEAVVAALSRSLGLVAGGPGTGKTTIILALVETALALGVPPARIALAAPTGKAARRIDEALGRTALGDADRPRASTLHGLLGLGPSLTARGPFTAAAPLPHRLVVVDEASMIGLEMLDALTQALPPEATLVLLGDPDQLPSVEAGAAFRALVESPALGAVRLTHSHRMREDDAGGAAILHAAQELKSGRWPDLPPDEGAGRRAWRGPRFLAAGATSTVDRFLTDWAAEHMAWQEEARDVWGSPEDLSPETKTRLVSLLEATTRARLLAVTRGTGRATGVGAINAWFHGRAAEAQGAGDPPPPFLPGEPVMVTENDPGRGLANGDSGVILRMARRTGGTSLAAAFSRGAEVVLFPLAGLQRNLVLSYAVTVHKAQGSEHDHVALLLPDEDLPLLGRELLYTALTRARRSVTVVGNAELAARAAARVALRSGTLTRWLALADAPP